MERVQHVGGLTGEWAAVISSVALVVATRVVHQPILHAWALKACYGLPVDALIGRHVHVAGAAGQGNLFQMSTNIQVERIVRQLLGHVFFLCLCKDQTMG